MKTHTQKVIQVGPVPESPGTKNPWPNRIANLSQLMGMQIYHVHTPIGLGGDTIGSLFLEYWERLIQSYQKEWISSKLITEQQAEQFLDNLAEEVNKHNTFMSWYSVVARKKGYSGPTIQFDDVDDNNNLHTTVYE